ncbi:hypothetical protein [Desulfosporosinus fructosivorans]
MEKQPLRQNRALGVKIKWCSAAPFGLSSPMGSNSLIQSAICATPHGEQFFGFRQTPSDLNGVAKQHLQLCSLIKLISDAIAQASCWKFPSSCRLPIHLRNVFSYTSIEYAEPQTSVRTIAPIHPSLIAQSLSWILSRKIVRFWLPKRKKGSWLANPK